MSPEDIAFVKMICDGKNAKEMSAELDVCEASIYNTKRRIIKELQACTIPGLVKHAIRSGWVEA